MEVVLDELSLRFVVEKQTCYVSPATLTDETLCFLVVWHYIHLSVRHALRVTIIMVNTVSHRKGCHSPLVMLSAISWYEIVVHAAINFHKKVTKYLDFSTCFAWRMPLSWKGWSFTLGNGNSSYLE